MLPVDAGAPALASLASPSYGALTATSLSLATPNYNGSVKAGSAAMPRAGSSASAISPSFIGGFVIGVSPIA